ncbi:D-xylose 1-dehydrogenase Gfo6 [Halospeciosus flavus]|uniref:D-xylose 1-dehydrogenase Gfo6 n=1 Tax=Halospeciosus flavus TaxID=3032283 RepID=A0ABD5Z3B0_9EURY|nr:D-xylose 1-dehydrogenase Gfo6 [Halospeciosus flavus]
MLDDYFDSFAVRDWEEPTDAEPIRFAMVGLGWWTREQAIPAVEDADYAVTSALVTSSPEKAADLADEVDTVEATLTYEEFLNGEATDAYDAVYICTPNAVHREQAVAAAEHGKPVLCEKPLAADVEDAEAIVDAFEEADVPLMTAYRVQTGSTARRARDLVRGGAIGDVVAVNGHMSDTMVEFTDPDSWRLNPDLSGGTTINDIGVYPLNTMRFVLDTDPRAVQATATSTGGFFEGVDEHAAFHVEFSDSLLAACTVSHSATGASSLRFVGTEGELTLEGVFFPDTDTVLRLTRDGVTGEFRPETANQMREEFDYFANHLQRGEPVEPDGEDGLVDMHVVEALYVSAETGERVAVEMDI